MHRTQIYFEQDLFNSIKQIARQNSQSVSAYIREVLRHKVEQTNSPCVIDVSAVAGIWQDYDINQEKLRKKSWK